MSEDNNYTAPIFRKAKRIQPKDIVPEKKYCYYCGKRLKPNYDYEKGVEPGLQSFEQHPYITGIRGYGNHSNNYFCNNDCARIFAISAAKAGFSRKKSS